MWQMQRQQTKFQLLTKGSWWLLWRAGRWIGTPRTWGFYLESRLLSLHSFALGGEHPAGQPGSQLLAWGGRECVSSCSLLGMLCVGQSCAACSQVGSAYHTALIRQWRLVQPLCCLQHNTAKSWPKLRDKASQAGTLILSFNLLSLNTVSFWCSVSRGGW